MTEPIAYLNGQFVPVSSAKLGIFDLGIVQAATVTEMIRTFRHRPFRLDEHLQRLFRSVRCVGFQSTVTQSELQTIVDTVVAENRLLIDESQDLGIIVFMTAGQNASYLPSTERPAERTPSVCVHTFPLPFDLWLNKLNQGQHLVTPSTRHIPADSVDPKIKTRSRLHWYLADQQAHLVDPTASAVLLDHQGNITETSTGNILLVRGNTIQTPSPRITLGGVSQQVVAELAPQIGLRFEHADIQAYDVINADEVFTSSTPYCLLPVTRFNGQSIGSGSPGKVFGKLVTAWSDLVGLNIFKQISDGAAIA